tara:strand:- start:69 stop:416 length:348 start_codon:yes stop_codon:yes gene_type:complete
METTKSTRMVLLQHYACLQKRVLEARDLMNARYDEFGDEGFDQDYPNGPIGDPESLVNEAVLDEAKRARNKFRDLCLSAFEEMRQTNFSYFLGLKKEELQDWINDNALSLIRGGH